MSQRFDPGDFGDPALRIAGFQLWIHGREFVDAQDFDDGNWLRVTAHCGGSGASVWAQGSILMAPDIRDFGLGCERIRRGESSTAALEPIEPYLKLSLEVVDGVGHLRLRVDITADYMTQSHRFDFEVDQTFLPMISSQCAAILREYPVRGVRAP